MINFVFSIGKQPYRDVINFVSYIHVVYSYNDINFTYLYMRTNCEIVNAKKCNFAVADKHDAVLEMIDGQAIL